MKKQILSLKEVQQITPENAAYIVCKNPECTEMFHTLTPMEAVVMGIMPDFFALHGLEEADADDQIDVAQALLTDPNTYSLAENVCEVLDGKLQQVITASAFKETATGTEPVVSDAVAQPSEIDYYKYRDLELDLQKQKQDAEIEVLKAQARKINAEALLQEYQAQEFKVTHNIG